MTIAGSPWHALAVGVFALLASTPPLKAQSPVEIEVALADWSKETGSPRAQAAIAAMREMYRFRGFEPLWLGTADKLEAARATHAALRAIARDGLDPAAYEVAPLAGEADRVRYELATTRAFVRAAIDLSLGRVDPSVIDDDLRVAPRDLNPPTILFALTRSPAPDVLLQALAPRYAAYWGLRAELARLRRMPPWPLPNFTQAKLELGMVAEEIAALRRYLLATGDLPALPEAADGPADDAASIAAGLAKSFDGELASAVRQFQRRHGLLEDGIVGPMTQAAMQVSLAARIRQIEANMERWRWLPDSLGAQHIWVNVADFTLQLVDRERIVHRTEVIVGQPYHRTPMFSRPMTYLVINPYWVVPVSIATKEILPAIQRDPAYLDANRFEVLDRDGRIVDPAQIDWRQISAKGLPYTFRQRHGDGNALGRIKFMLPNEFSVYLHDTPTKSLFARATRAFSHGCVRVAEPLQLAARLLAPQGWDLAGLEAAVRSDRQQVVPLPTPLPVHLTYFTAWIDDQGLLQLRDDIYGRDARLLAALDRP